MSSAVEDQIDFSKLKLQPLDAPPPPRYSEEQGIPDATANPKTNDDANYKHGPWLLKKTSVHVESTPSNVLDDNLSGHVSISTTRSDEKRPTRNLLSKIGRQPTSDKIHEDGISISDSHEASLFGTTVSIEAARPRKLPTKQREMKGLEQAASVKRWAGDGKPAEPWGKLIKDPELWDTSGDVLVYFGYQRPHASFRIRSAILEATNSEIIKGKLQDGFKGTSAAPSMYSSPPDAKNLHMDRKGQQSAPSNAGSTRLGTESLIRYEIHFPPPDEGSKTTVLRHHITTRNFFAFLLKKPLVGLTLYQALVDLQQRLQLYLPHENNCTNLLIDYVSDVHLHKVSNDPAAAAGLLAWSEDAEVRWRDGWREGFVHSCGMFSHSRNYHEFHDISHVSRTLLERSYLELEARIQEAEGRLSSFNFDDIWAGTEAQFHPSRVVFDQFRQFLESYYTKANKRWPPTPQGQSNGPWLTSDIIFQLQRDFAALYEYHVNREVVWSKTKDPEALYRDMVSKADGRPVEKSNGQDFSLTNLLYRFDKRHNFFHIPHPYPLLPEAAVINGETKQIKSKFYNSKAKALEKRTALAFSEASNATILDSAIVANGLTEAFVRYEKTDDLDDTSALCARKARWMLLYGILQVLATLSVDTPDLAFTEGVTYFLNPRLKGAPPWKADEEAGFEEASPKLSYCWEAPKVSWGKSDANP
ncbi:hypothetical protein ACLMJK_007050 [Lecanora helva]